MTSQPHNPNNRLTNMVDAPGTTHYACTDFGALLFEDGV
jgi:YD repeat-containing protein